MARKNKSQKGRKRKKRMHQVTTSRKKKPENTCLEAWQFNNDKPKHLDLQSSPSEEENEESLSKTDEKICLK